jgi:predicted nucleic acid-binding protein
MIVVSNTSPLTNLAAIGQFDLLRRLYSSINIADGVWDELNAMRNHWPAGLSAIRLEISYW